MIHRECDGCKGKMARGEPFYKVCLSEMIEKNQKLKHVGDLCKRCWYKTTKEDD